AGNALIGGGLVQRDILVGVTFGAVGADVSSLAAPDARPVLMVVGALQRVIARGMTAHAARMRQQFSDLGKHRTRAFRRVCDRLKFRWRLEALVGHGLRPGL